MYRLILLSAVVGGASPAWADTVSFCGQSVASSATQVRCCRPDVVDLRPLARLEGLRQLLLHGTAVTDLRPIAGLRRLEHLELDRSQVVDIAPLARLTGLRLLSLAGLAVTTFAPLRSLRGLAQLRLVGSAVPKRALADFRRRRPGVLVQGCRRGGAHPCGGKRRFPSPRRAGGRDPVSIGGAKGAPRSPPAGGPHTADGRCVPSMSESLRRRAALDPRRIAALAKAPLTLGPIRTKGGAVGPQPDGLAAVLSREARTLQRCQADRLKANPSLSGKVMLRFTVGPSGGVTDAKVETNTTGDGLLADCLVSRVRSFRFPPPAHGAAPFRIPVVLAPLVR